MKFAEIFEEDTRRFYLRITPKATVGPVKVGDMDQIDKLIKKHPWYRSYGSYTYAGTPQLRPYEQTISVEQFLQDIEAAKS